jgi:hypothetical protein
MLSTARLGSTGIFFLLLVGGVVASCGEPERLSRRDAGLTGKGGTGVTGLAGSGAAGTGAAGDTGAAGQGIAGDTGSAGTGLAGSNGAAGTGTAGTGAAGTGTAGTGAAGAGAAGTGAAGTGAAGMGRAGTGGAGTGAAGTGAAGTGAAGTGAAGTGTAGTGAAGTGAAGTGAAGTGAAGTGAAGTGAAGTGAAGVSGVNGCPNTAWTFTPNFICQAPNPSCGFAETARLPQYAIDGDTGTRYTSGKTQSGDENFVLSFAGRVRISGITLNAQGSANDAMRAYRVEYSATDGTTFVPFNPVVQGTGNANLTINFPATTMKAIKVYQTGMQPAGVTSWWSIHEITLVGCQQQ